MSRLLPPLTATLMAFALLPACSSDKDNSDPAPTDGGATDGGPTDDGGATDGGGGKDTTTQTSGCEDTPVPTTAPGDAVCSVEKSGAGLLVVADVLLPGKIIEGGAVLLDAKGDISCVGCGCVEKATDATWVICPDAVVSPGLIDAHNHVGWLNGKPWVAKAAGVDPALRWEHRHDWRKGKGGNPKITVSGGGASTDQKAFGELRYVLTGSTAIFGSGDLAGLMRDLDSTGSGKNGLGQPGAKYDTFPLGDSGGSKLKTGCSYGSIHSSPGSSTDAYAPHVSEGIDQEARNEFLCMTGQGSGAVDLLDKRSALIHAVGLTATEFGYMSAKGMRMIWSPRSNVSLYGDTARVTLAHRLGVSIGLGADWVPSGSINMLRELACAAYLNDNHFGGEFSDDELWQMATLGGARALAMDDAIGLLKVGHAGDLAVFRKDGRKGHSAVVNASTRDVALVVRGGEVLAGNMAVIAALEPSCETLGDVCGVEKGVCVKNAIGKTYAALKSAVGSGAYPLYFCDEPKDEPSCVPSRTLKPDSIDGSSLYAGMSDPKDTDGDGIANEADNCPTIFNPIRPLDAGKQSDVDGDGEGDACDVCPIDADTTVCTAFDPNDPDGDGKPSSEDNCPDKGNSDQADKDGDGKGDVCDPCPDAPNPGSAACLVDIVDTKTKAELIDQQVALKGLAVTAAANGGVFVQKNGIPAIDHGGIFIYVGDGPMPKVGDVIDINSAALTLYYGQKQLSGADWKVTGDKAAVEARLLDLDAIKKLTGTDKANSPHDGLLIKVVDAEVTNAKPAPGPGDAEGKNEFEISGGLRVDDAMWPFETPFIDPLPAKGQVLPVIVGPVSYRNEYMKILPRGMADIALGPPEVLAVTPAKAFQFAGVSGPTLPQGLTITLDHDTDVEVTVEVSVDDDTIAKIVGGPFVIAAGQTAVSVAIEGLKVGATTLHAKVKGSDKAKTAEIVIIDASAEPTVDSLTPDGAKVAASGAVSYTVTLSNPATADGVNVALTLEPADLGSVPATVKVPGGMLTVTFDFSAGAKAGAGTLTAATASGSAKVNLEVVDASNLSLDLSGWTISQTDSAKSYKIAAGTQIKGGGYLIIARKAAKAEFEARWKVTLGPDVIYIDSGDKMPSINGKETFSLADASGTVVDGPTIQLKGSAESNYQRKVPVGPAGEAGSWSVTDSGSSSPSPGSGQTTVGPSPGLYISEFSDSLGTGNFVYEYVELFYPGPKS